MNIEIRDTHEFSEADLAQLFLSVGWESGKYPDRLRIAMRKYESVYSAWDGDRLAGLVCVMDDGIMNAYIQYVLVDPEYQHMKIGSRLLEAVSEHYRDYIRIVLIAYSDKVPFYETCGFARGENKTPMFIEHM